MLIKYDKGFFRLLALNTKASLPKYFDNYTKALKYRYKLRNKSSKQSLSDCNNRTETSF